MLAPLLGFRRQALWWWFGSVFVCRELLSVVEVVVVDVVDVVVVVVAVVATLLIVVIVLDSLW